MGVKVLGSILALMGFLPESKTSPSSILTNLGCLSNISNGPGYKKVTYCSAVDIVLAFGCEGPGFDSGSNAIFA